MFVSSSNWLGRYLRKKQFNSEFSRKIIIFGFGFGFSESGQCFPIWGSWFGSVQVLVRAAWHGARPLGHSQPGPPTIVCMLSALPDQLRSRGPSPASFLCLPKEKPEHKRKKKIAKFSGYGKPNLDPHWFAHGQEAGVGPQDAATHQEEG